MCIMFMMPFFVRCLLFMLRVIILLFVKSFFLFLAVSFHSNRINFSSKKRRVFYLFLLLQHIAVRLNNHKTSRETHFSEFSNWKRQFNSSKCVSMFIAHNVLNVDSTLYELWISTSNALRCTNRTWIYIYI